MVEKSALICESGLVSTTAESEGVLGGQEVGVLTRKACLTLQIGRRKEQTAQREQQLCLTMQSEGFGAGCVSDSEKIAESTRRRWGKG